MWRGVGSIVNTLGRGSTGLLMATGVLGGFPLGGGPSAGHPGKTVWRGARAGYTGEGARSSMIPGVPLVYPPGSPSFIL